MIFLSGKGSNKREFVKAVFLNTSIALERLTILIKRANLLYKTTGYLQNRYHLLFPLLFFLVKATKIYIHGVRLVYHFIDHSKKKHQTASFLHLELMGDETKPGLGSDIRK